jgi:hypothetical protein
MKDLPKIRDQVDIKNQFVDGTPDGNYALRILQTFRARCNEKFILDGEWSEWQRKIYDVMNEHQDLRAKELDDAIARLSKPTTIKSACNAMLDELSTDLKNREQMLRSKYPLGHDRRDMALSHANEVLELLKKIESIRMNL